ncbi:MAG: hypothetical protein IPM27_02720 [Nitrosomonadales bacterium]|nr:hypothetical protein [Nitrosomonadales bacterium]
MAILVSDTSVLIELERGGLLEPAFSFGLIMVVPDLLYRNELEGENGPYLRTLGLGVVSLTPDEVALAQAIMEHRPALSLPDCFALSCALRQDHVLVTGDQKLRSEAKARNAEVYGMLWILDQMELSGKFSFTLLYEGLSRISAHKRCRLPKDEVAARLLRWTH